MKQNLTPRINRLEPNIIIDGGMEIWPEGTSRVFATLAQGYGAALFQTANGSTISVTNSQQSSVPHNSIPFSNQLSKTASGSQGSANSINLNYSIEGYNTQQIFAKEFSIIFWVKSSVSSNRTLSVMNTGLTHSYVQQYNISAANTWQLRVLKVPALSSCPGVINKTNDFGIRLFWNVVAGASLQTSILGTWQSGAYYSGVGEDTTWLTGTSHDFSIAGVIILPGDWTNLTSAGYTFLRAGRDFSEELAKSQRYYEKSWALDIPAGTSGDTKFYTGITNAGGGGAVNEVKFAVTKRATPSIRYWNGGVENVAFFRRASADTTTSLDVASLNNPTGFSPVNNTLIGAFVVFQLGFGWSADARF